MAAQALQLLRQRRPPHGFDKLLAEMRRVPYLAEYVRNVVRRLGRYPDYYTERLPDELKKAPQVNVMYPVGDGIYIHIYMPPEGTVSGYRKYHVVEPPRPPQELFDLVEMKMAELITERDIARDPETKRKLMLSFLERIVTVVPNRVDYASLLPHSKKLKRVPVYRGDYNYLRYYLIRDKIGLGVLEPFIRDPYIEDISCDGVGYIYIVHKVFGPLETNIEFRTEEELDRFVIELSERIGKPVSHARPIVDATLPDGSRINIVFGRDVSLKGSNFTIRKFSKKPISIIQLIKWGTLDERIGAYLWILLLEGMSGFIAGETASGKTTSLNAIIAFIRPTAKIVTIEDTAEVQVPHENWVRELTRETGSVESSVTMFDLLKAALRQRPNYIIVGEIRGAEGNIAFQAMQSVAYETPIMIRDRRRGTVSLIPIGKFVDSFYLDGEEGIPKYIDGYDVLSLNRWGQVVWAPIRYVLRHRADEIYRIEYEGGGVIRATGSHSVFVLDEDSLEVRPSYVKELRPGDLLVTFVNRRKVLLRQAVGVVDTASGADPPTDSDEVLLNVLEGEHLESTRRLLRSIKEGGAASVTYTTKSARSAVAITWLARLMGMESRLVRVRDQRYGSYFRVHIRDADSGTRPLYTRVPLKPIARIVEKYNLYTRLPQDLAYAVKRFKSSKQRFVSHRVARRLLEFLKRYRSAMAPDDKELLNRLEALLESDVAVAVVRTVSKEKYRGYVYDLSVPDTELFIGGEIPVALHNTGHPVLATFHAGSVIRLVQRLTSPPINVPKTQLDNLNFVIIQSAVYREGVMLRRMISVNEILGYDATADSIIYIPVFTWDPTTDKFLFRGRGASYLLEEKIATIRGIPRRYMRLIYDELELRAQILRELVRKNITDYYEVFRIFAKTYGIIDEKLKTVKAKEMTQEVILEGLEEALKRIRRNEL